ncbi:hypothetical protein [Brevibacillus laterosporus]|uniref:hypothetical protein n=1 Tax=Brevibacillus laterosporus TaxID=1465 RepID=UPI003D1E5EBF
MNKLHGKLFEKKTAVFQLFLIGNYIARIGKGIFVRFNVKKPLYLKFSENRLYFMINKLFKAIATLSTVGFLGTAIAPATSTFAQEKVSEGMWIGTWNLEHLYFDGAVRGSKRNCN